MLGKFQVSLGLAFQHFIHKVLSLKCYKFLHPWDASLPIIGNAVPIYTNDVIRPNDLNFL